MHKIDTETATAENEFTDGDEGQAIPATDLDAAWFNTVQRELCNAVVGLGTALNPANDSQLLAVLQEYGIACSASTTGDVAANFPGSRVIFHNAASFVITGTMRTGSFILVFPSWGDSSPDYIDVTYGGLAHRIYKWQAMVGVVTNAGEGSSIYWRPVIIPKVDGTLPVNNGEFGEFVDKSFVEFEYREASSEDELAPWQVWQLKSYWKINQVKRVRCTNVGEGFNTIAVYKNTSGGWRNVKFYEGGYREFVCIGQVTDALGRVFAVLLVNGEG